jgi:hypothetical protein
VGWWAVDIMGGDTPLDFEDTMFELQEIEKFPEEGDRNVLRPDGFTPEVISDYLKQAKSWGNLDIGLQVLGHMMMEVGAPMSEDVKKAVLLGCDNDEWAREDSERLAEIDKFRNVVARYDSTGPVELETKGLMQTIFEGEQKN